MNGWKFKVDNKLRAYGETDYKKKLVRINKKRHVQRKSGKRKDSIPKRDATIINTLVHERAHIQHPNMKEKNVRKYARKKVKRMSPKEKVRLYNLLKR